MSVSWGRSHLCSKYLLLDFTVRSTSWITHSTRAWQWLCLECSCANCGAWSSHRSLSLSQQTPGTNVRSSSKFTLTAVCGIVLVYYMLFIFWKLPKRSVQDKLASVQSCVCLCIWILTLDVFAENWVILGVFYYPALYYPLLACGTLHNKVGYVLGSLLSWTHFGVLVWQKIDCPKNPLVRK